MGKRPLLSTILFYIKKIIINLLPLFIVKHIYKLKNKSVSMETLSYNRFQDMSFHIRKSIPQLPDDIDLVVGIPRSGMIPAYMIALFMNKPCCSLTELKNGILPENGNRQINSTNSFQKILIVDDSVSSGTAINKAKDDIKTFNIPQKILYYSVFVTENSKNFVDYYGVITDPLRIFQWNYCNHSILRNTCMDIDGVLCIDPTEEENDDGDLYRHFLLNAKPLYIPKVEIYALVTSRLEKYRYETESWLKINNVKYEKLIMLDLPDAATRQKLNLHAQFKAQIYKKDKRAKFFIESNDRQAREIAQLSHKPCICIETDSIYRG